MSLSRVPARELFLAWALWSVVVQLSASAQVLVLDPVFEVVRRSGRVSNSMCRPDLGPMLHPRVLDRGQGRDLFPGRTQSPPPTVLMRLL